MAEYESKTKEGKCIFCEIVEGKIPAGIFWQDDEFMAFLASYPSTEGLTCVVPKKHFGSDVLKMPDDVLGRFMTASKKVAGVLENYYADVGRVGVIMEGLGIDHAHIKLIPLHGTDHLKRGEWKQFLSQKESWSEKYDGSMTSADGPNVPVEKLKELAEKIQKTQEV